MEPRKMFKHLDNRKKLIEKMAKDEDYEPSKEELHKAYGYLDYCLGCEKKIRFGEPFTHGFEGNCHKFGCSVIARGSGYLFRIISIPFYLIFLLFGGLFELFKLIFKKLKGEDK